MRIAYFTSHILPKDFQLLEAKASTKPNPAGQNFHGRLINAIAPFAEVQVISLIPNREGLISEGERNENGLAYRYVDSGNNKIARAILAPGRTAKQVSSPVDVVIYDSLSITLAKAAKKAAKATGAKLVAICTDSPYNLTGTKKSYSDLLVSLSSNCDGYFCLTEGLNKLFNKRGAPSLIRMGIAEFPEKKESIGRAPYFYYGGALFIKDGTKAMIDAYNALKPDYDLVIAGHGTYEKEAEEASNANPRIHFLGQISKEENWDLECGASLLINPRLYRKDLDDVSIPSKVIEYLATGNPIVSTKSEDLKKAYPDDVNWIEDGAELTKFLADHLDKNGKLMGLKENCAAKKLASVLGFKAIGEDITSFLQTLIRK